MPTCEHTQNTLAWFLFDVSDSVQVVHQALESDLLAFYQAEIEEELARADIQQWGAIFFGQRAELAIAPQSSRHTPLPRPQILGTATDIADAIHLAREVAKTFGYTQADFMIWSDGHWPDQKWEELGISGKLSFHPILPKAKEFHDMQIALVMRDPVRQFEHAQGKAIVTSNQPGVFTVEIRAQDKIHWQETIELSKPGNFAVYFSVPITAPNQEIVHAQVSTTSFTDGCTLNNIASAQVRVLGKPVFLVMGDSASFVNLDFVDVIPTKIEQLPNLLAAHPRSVLVIVDGCITELEPVASIIQQYVHAGGGLWVFGNQSTLGPGGYSGTTLETILPVWCSQKQNQPLALCIALDISGSMAEPLAGIAKIEAAQAGIKQALQYLNPEDYFGLIGFRQSAVPCLEIGLWGQHQTKLPKILQSLHPQGSTNINSVLQACLEAFAKAPQDSIKHVLIISDGLDTQPNPQTLDLGAKLSQKQVKISVIATGTDEYNILQRLSQIGQGVFVRWDTQSLAELLTRQIQSLHQPEIQQGRFELISQEDWGTEPLKYCQGFCIERFIPVQAKAWSKIWLQTGQNPIVVTGYYGLGRSAVLSTNFSATWAGNLPESIAKDMIRDIGLWLMGHVPSVWQWTLEPVGEQWMAKIKRAIDARAHVSAYEPQLYLLMDWIPQPIELLETGQYEYEAWFAWPKPGSYVLQIGESSKSDQRILMEQRTNPPIQSPHQPPYIIHDAKSFWIPYPSEYRKLGQSALPILPSSATPVMPQPLLWWPCLWIALGMVFFIAERIFPLDS